MTSREYIRQKASVMSRALDDLSPTYDPGAGRNPIGFCREIPSEAEILQVLHLLDDVFYPGYRCDCHRGDPIETLVIERLDEAYDILFRQIKRALPLRWAEEQTRVRSGPVERLEEPELTGEAERLVGVFFERLPEVRELLKLDVIAAFNGDPAAQSYAEVILSYPAIRAITVHRVAHELYLLDVPLIPRLMNEHIHRTTGIDIHPGASIGKSFFIDHGTGVVIGETSQIGNGVKLYQSVTLGAHSLRLDDEGQAVRGVKRHPTIEDDVLIYSGATILGGDTVVGQGSVVNGNVFLTRSVPPGTTVTQRYAWEMNAARQQAS